MKKVIRPCVDYKDSYLALKQEFVERQEDFVPFPLRFDAGDFDAFLTKMQNHSKGLDVDGFVANSTYWLVEDSEVIGVANIRHELIEKLLQHGGHIGYGIRPSYRRKGNATFLLSGMLQVAKGLKINNVLVTCAKNNEASRKTIEHNGGIFEGETYFEEEKDWVQRFWISNLP